MTERWLGYSARSERGELTRALRAVNPHASIAFAHNAEELRAMALGQGHGRVGVIVGLTDSGVSAVNLAAAVARDGGASEVVLVARGASGSLKSRALSAGVSDVIDVSLLATASDEVACGYDVDEPDLSAEDVPTTLAVPQVPRASVVPEVVPSGRMGPARHGRSVGHGTESPSHAEPWSGQWHVIGEDEGPDARDVPADLLGGTPRAGMPGRRGAILTFASGRGGVGKTTLVAVSAAVAASWGMRVALCDLDLSCGNLYSYFGLAHGCDLTQATRGGAPNAADLQRMGQPIDGGLRLWGPCAQPEMAEVVMPHVGAVLGLLASQADLVLVDTSTAFTDAVAQAAQVADRLLLLSDGGPGTAAALARLGALAVRLGVARTRIVRVSNRCDPRGRDEIVLNRANVGLETARDFRVLDGGGEVGELMAAGRAMAAAEALMPFGSSVASTLAKVLNEMGRLPASDEAARAAREEAPRRRWRLGRRRKVS